MKILYTTSRWSYLLGLCLMLSFSNNALQGQIVNEDFSSLTLLGISGTDFVNCTSFGDNSTAFGINLFTTGPTNPVYTIGGPATATFADECDYANVTGGLYRVRDTNGEQSCLTINNIDINGFNADVQFTYGIADGTLEADDFISVQISVDGMVEEGPVSFPGNTMGATETFNSTATLKGDFLEIQVCFRNGDPGGATGEGEIFYMDDLIVNGTPCFDLSSLAVALDGGTPNCGTSGDFNLTGIGTDGTYTVNYTVSNPSTGTFDGSATGVAVASGEGTFTVNGLPTGLNQSLIINSLEDADGCEVIPPSTVSVLYAVSEEPTVMILPNGGLDLCAGDERVLNADPDPNSGAPYTYAWTVSTGGSLSSMTSATPTLTIAEMPGVSAVTVTLAVTSLNGAGCESDPDQVVFNIAAPPSPLMLVNGDPQSTCAGETETYTIDSPPAGHTFNWSLPNGGNFQVINADNAIVTWNVFTSGPRILRIEDTDNTTGCTTVNDFTINVEGPLSIDTEPEDDTVCENLDDASFTVAATNPGTGPLIYRWQFSTDGVVFNDIDGTVLTTATGFDAATLTIGMPIPASYDGYQFKVFVSTAECPEIMSTTVTLNVDPEPSFASMMMTNVTCNAGSNGIFSFTVDPGTNLEYAFSTGATFTGGVFVDAVIPGPNEITGLAAGTYTVRLQDKDTDCYLDKTFEITEPDPLDFVVSTIDVCCNGADDGSITVIASGGSGNYEYSNDGGETYQPGNTFTGLAPDTYEVQVRDADDTNCVTAATMVTIDEPDPITFDEEITDVECFGESNGMIDPGVLGGTPPYSYSWTGPDGYSNTVNTILYTNDFDTDISDFTPIAGGDAPDGQPDVDFIDADDPGMIYMDPTNGGILNEYWSESTDGEDRALTFYRENMGEMVWWDLEITNNTGDLLTDITIKYDFEVPWVRYAASENMRSAQVVWDVDEGSGFMDAKISAIITNAGVPDGKATTWLTDAEMNAYGLALRNQTISFDCLNVADGDSFILRLASSAPTMEFRNMNYGIDNMVISSSNVAAKINDLAAGTYNVTVTDCKGCTAETSFDVNQPDEITIDGLSAANVCADATSFELSYISTTGMPDEYSIELDPMGPDIVGFVPVSGVSLPSSPITVNIPMTAAGTYDFLLTLTNTTTGCDSEAIPFQLTVDPLPLVSATVVDGMGGTVSGMALDHIVCSDEEFSFDVNDFVGTNNYTLSWVETRLFGSGTVTGFSGNGDFMNSSATAFTSSTLTGSFTNQSGNSIKVTFTIDVTNPTTGCTNSYTFAVGIRPEISLVDDMVDLPTVLCNGESTGDQDVSVNLSGGTRSVEYAWTGTDLSFSEQSGTLTGSPPYTVPSTMITNSSMEVRTATLTLTPVLDYTSPFVQECTGEAITYMITIIPTPVVDVTNNATDLCTGDTTDIDLSTMVTGTVVDIVVMETTATGISLPADRMGVALPTKLEDEYDNMASTEAVLEYTITPKFPDGEGGFCFGTAETTTVTISPTPGVELMLSSPGLDPETLNSIDGPTDFEYILCDESEFEAKLTGLSSNPNPVWVEIVINDPDNISAFGTGTFNIPVVGMPTLSSMLNNPNSSPIEPSFITGTVTPYFETDPGDPGLDMDECVGTALTFNVKVLPTPEADIDFEQINLGNNTTGTHVCTGEDIAIDVTANGAVRLDWEVINIGGGNSSMSGIAIGDTGSFDLEDGLNEGAFAFDAFTLEREYRSIVVFSVVPVYICEVEGGDNVECEGESFEYRIRVWPTPEISDPADIIVCSEEDLAGQVVFGQTTTYSESHPNADGQIVYDIDIPATAGITELAAALDIDDVDNGTDDSDPAVDLSMLTGFPGAFTNETDSPITFTVTVTPKWDQVMTGINSNATPCPGTPVMIDITVEPKPVVTTTVFYMGDDTQVDANPPGMPYELTICSDDTVGININSMTATTPGAFLWVEVMTNDPDNLLGFGPGMVTQYFPYPALDGQTFTTTPNNETDMDAIIDIKITPFITTTVEPTMIDVEDCIGMPTHLRLTVQPEPVAVATPDDQDVCDDEMFSFDLDDNGTSVDAAEFLVELDIPDGLTQTSGTTDGAVLAGPMATVSGQFSNSTQGTLTVTYTITPTSAAGCVGDPITVTVNVDARPETDPSGGDICIGDDGTIFPNVTLTSGGSIVTYKWTYIDGSATGFGINGSPPFPGPSVGDMFGTENIVVNAYAPTASTGTVSFQLTVTDDNGCESIFSLITIEILDDNNAGVADPITDFCEDAGNINLNDLLTGEDPFDTEITTWVADPGNPPGGSLSNNFFNPTGVEGPDPLLFSFTYTVDNGACPPDSEVVTIRVQPIPTAGTYTGIQPLVCEGDEFDLSALLDDEDPNGTWLVIEGTGGSIAGDIFDATGATPGLFTLEYTVSGNGICPDDTETVQLQVGEIPNAGNVLVPYDMSHPASPDFCADFNGGQIDLFTLLDGTQSMSGTWAQVAGPGTLVASLYEPGDPPSPNPVEAEFTYIVTQTSECGPPDTSRVFLTIQPLPDAGDLNPEADNSVCTDDNSFDLFTLIQDYDLGGTWTEITASGATLSGTSNANLDATTAIPGNGYIFRYQVAPIPPCTDPAFIEVTVNISEAATVDAGESQTICFGQSAIMDASLGGSATMGTWTGFEPGGMSDVNDPNAEFTPAQSQSNTAVTLTWTSNDPDGSNACHPATDDVVIFVNDAVDIVDAGDDQVVCFDVEQIDLSGVVTLSSGSTAASGVWSTDGDGMLTQVDNDATYVPTAAERLGSTITFTFTANDPDGTGPCEGGQTDQVVVDIEQLPVFVVDLDQPEDIAIPGGVPYKTIVCNNTMFEAFANVITPVSTSGDPLFVRVQLDDPDNLVGGSFDIAAPAADVEFSDMLVNTGTEPKTIMLTLTPYFETNPLDPRLDDGECEGDAIEIMITVNPTPTVDDPADITVCEEDLTDVIFVGDVDGTIFMWTNDNTDIGLAADGMGDISFTADNPTDAPITATITVTPKYTNISGGPECLGEPETFTITVNPTPTVEDPEDQIVCEGDMTADVIFVGTVAGTVFEWTNDNTDIGLAASGTGDILAFTAENPTDAPITANITVTPVTDPDGSPECPGASQTFSITVNPTPVVDEVTDIEVCHDDEISEIIFTGPVTATGISYMWMASGDDIGLPALMGTNTIPSFVADNPSNTVLTTTITVTPKFTNPNGGPECLGEPMSFDIIVNPEPVGGAADDEICSGDQLAVDLQGIVNDFGNGVLSDFTWIAAENLNVGGESTMLQSGDVINDVLTNLTGLVEFVIYTVTPTSEGGDCEGESFEVTVTVLPEPVYAEDIMTMVCSGDMIDVTLPTSDDNDLDITSYDISSAAAGATTGTGITDPNAIAGDAYSNLSNDNITITYTITPYAGDCAGEPFDVIVTVKPEPVFTGDLDNTVCSDATIDVLLPEVDDDGLAIDEFVVTADVAAGLLGTATESPTPSSTVDISGDSFTNTSGGPLTVVYTVTPYTMGCPGESFTITVTIDPEPDVDDIEDGACSDVAIGVSLPSLDDNDNPIDSYDVTADVDPSLDGDATEANGTTDTGLIAGDVFTNTTNSTLDVVYTVTPYDGDCPGDPFTITVTISPEPVLSGDLDKMVCSDELTDIIFTTIPSSVGADSYTIMDIRVDPELTPAAGNATTGADKTADAIADDSFTNVTDGPLTVEYDVIPVAGDCEGDKVTIILTVKPEPVMSDELDATVCSDEPSGIVLATNGISVAAAQYEIIDITNPDNLPVIAGNPVTGLTSDINEIADDAYENKSILGIPSVVLYQVRPISADGCVGDIIVITLNVLAEPVGTDSQLAICTSDPNNPMGVDIDLQSFISNGVLSNFTWVGTTTASGSELLGVSTTPQMGGVITDTLINNTPFDQTVIYTVTPISQDDCEGEPFEITVVVQPAIVADIITNEGTSICSDGPAVNFTGNAIGGLAPYTFDWSIAATTGSVVPNLVVSNLSPDQASLSGSGEGTVTIQLIITDANNCISGATTEIFTIAPATANFSSMAGSPDGLTIDFTDLSSQATSWSWDFGDGTGTSTDQNPSYTYLLPGEYEVCLDIDGPCGMDQICEMITVTFVPTPACDQINLVTGDNVISLDIIPDDNTIDDMFADIITDGNLIQIIGINPNNGAASIYIPGFPFNSLQTFEPGYGYLVRMSGDDILDVCGTAIDPSFKVDLIAGLNIVAYIPQQPTPSADYFADLGTNLVIARTFENNIQQAFIPGFPFNSLMEVKNGFGYVLQLNQPVGAANWRGQVNTSYLHEFYYGYSNLENATIGETVRIYTEDGIEVGEMEILPGGVLNLAVIYGDVPYTEDITEGILPGSKLLFGYQDQIIDPGVVFKGNMNANELNLEFDLLTNTPDVAIIELDWSIYPNPSTGQFIVELEGPENLDNIRIEVINSFGQIIEQSELLSIDNTNLRHPLDLRDYAGGTYHIRIVQSDGKISVKPVVITK